MKPEWLDEAVEALKGRRLCLCFGSWYGSRLTSAEEESLDEDWEPNKVNWHRVHSLNDILHDATNGDRAAWAILDKCGLRHRYLSLLNSS